MDHRNRSEGWKHAKLSGHENEELVKHLFDDETNQKEFLKRLGKENCKITHISLGGLKEKNVPSVLSGTTKSKTDLWIDLDDGSKLKISIKKSLCGQVYLIPIKHFVDGLQKQYNITIPDDVKRGIELYWGSAEDTIDIVEKYGTYKSYENRKHRLVGDTLKDYNEELFNKLITWFRDNIKYIFDFCFARGLAKNENDWANVIWYINKLGENNVDEMFLVEDLANYLDSISDEETDYGSANHGSTIQLPFGFVQWHSPQKTIPGCIQFHHNYIKIKKSKK